MAKTNKKTKKRKVSTNVKTKNVKKTTTKKQNNRTSTTTKTPKRKNSNNKVKKEKVVVAPVLEQEPIKKPSKDYVAKLLETIKQKFAEYRKNKSNAKKIAKNKNNNFKKNFYKYIRKIRMYGLNSVIPKKYIITGITSLVVIIVLIASIVMLTTKKNTINLSLIPDKIDQIKTVSFNIDDSNDIVTSSKAYSGLKDYYEYDFDKVFNLDKSLVMEYVIKYNKSNGEIFIVLKPTENNHDTLKTTIDNFLSTNKISNYLYKEYQGYLIYIKSNNSDNDALILSKIMQSNIRVFSILQELKKDDIEKTLGIKDSYYDEALVKTAMLRSDTCSYIIIKPKNNNAKVKIENAMNEYYAGLEAKWQGKNENNYELVTNRYFEEYQGYLIYVVSNDNQLVMDLIKG